MTVQARRHTLGPAAARPPLQREGVEPVTKEALSGKILETLAPATA
jgi:hypothetical protein